MAQVQCVEFRQAVQAGGDAAVVDDVVRGVQHLQLSIVSRISITIFTN